jgi:hypothetical protein
LALKENSNFSKLGGVGQSQMRVSLSRLVSQYEAALCAETGKEHIFGLAPVSRASEDKKQLCELQKVVSTCGHDEMKNSDA